MCVFGHIHRNQGVYVRVCNRIHFKLPNQSAVTDISICQAVKKSDRAYTVSGIVAKYPKWQIQINIAYDTPK